MIIPTRLSIFFGAGAEAGYGMPTGGRFALDIFRRPLDDERALFQEMRRGIDPHSAYATKWLPKDYRNKRISVFGKSEKTQIFESSLEYRRRSIRQHLDDYDTQARAVLTGAGVTEEAVDAAFQTAAGGRRLGDRTYEQVVRLDGRLGDRHPLFASTYFSAMLDLLRERSVVAPVLQKLVRATLQLYVGSLGQDLVSSLNQDLFTEAPAELAVFDDLDGLFRLEHMQAGLEAYELVMEAGAQPTPTTGQPVGALFEALAFGVLERIMSSCLDYQALVDGHFRYLYSPGEWAKFCKISIFLHSVRSYIAALEADAAARLTGGNGYYHDLLPALVGGRIVLQGVSTANYTSLFDEVMTGAGQAMRASFLNGSIRDYYDPYRNAIVRMALEEVTQYGRFVVPFLFTQSGIKPLTTVEMSRRYVQFYDAMAGSDAVVVVGFGFNGDDSHINGMFRQLVERRIASGGPRIFVCWYCEDPARFDDRAVRQELARKIRVERLDDVELVPVNDRRQTTDGTNWLDHLVQRTQVLNLAAAAE